MALPFKDRVLQWAIYLQVNDFFQKGYIEHSYACIHGRGTHDAVAKLQYWLRKISRKKDKYYFLKMDVSKYFYRVDHSVLLKILKDKILDNDLIWLFKKIILQNTTPFGLEINYEEEIRIYDRGMPIGNLTSQMFANIYLNQLDNFVKRKLKEKYYIRYMDDFLVLHNDKKYLQDLKRTIEEFLEENLQLKLNNKTCIRPVTLGIDYLGAKIWGTHVKIRKSTALKIKRRLKKIQKQYHDGEINFVTANSTVQSYIGLLKHYSSYNLRSKIFKNFELRRGKNAEVCIRRQENKGKSAGS